MRSPAQRRLAIGLGAVASFLAIEPHARAGDPTPAPAPAQPIAEEILTLAREVAEALDVGHHAAAAERLDADACAALAAAPTAAYDVAAAVMRTHPVALKFDPAAAVLLVDRLGGLASADDPSPHAIGVRTIRDLLRALTGRLHGQTGPLEELRTILVSLRKLEAKLPPLDRIFAAGLEVARFVAAARASDADAWGAVLAATDPLRRANATDEGFLRTVATAELQLGRLVAASDGATARPLLERALTVFSAKAWAEKKKEGKWTEDTLLFNRALTAARNLGGAAKIAYVSETFWARGRMLSAKVPVLSGWDWSYGDSNQDFGKLVRKREAGDDVEIQIWGYNGWTEYTMADGSVIPGENIDGFLKKGMKDDRSVLTKLSRDTRTTGALNATIKETRGYDLKGFDPEDVPTRYRNWFFKYSLGLKRYFNVALTQTGPFSEKDPEVLFLLDSLEEHSGS